MRLLHQPISLFIDFELKTLNEQQTVVEEPRMERMSQVL